MVTMGMELSQRADCHPLDAAAGAAERREYAMKKLDGYLSQITSFLDGAYSQGYTDGYDRAKTLFGEHDRGVAHFQRATEEEIKLHGIELAGWCVECNKPIEGRWVGVANFCPWCGRVIRWIHKEEEPKE